MTINHLTLKVSKANFSSMLSWYLTALAPIGYVQKIKANDSWYGMGPKDGFPHFWLQALDEGQTPTPTHVAFDASTQASVVDFHNAGVKAGGVDHGKPGIRPEISVQPYYAAFLLDPEGNNIEAACLSGK